MFDFSSVLAYLSGFWFSWIISIGTYLLTAIGIYKMGKNLGFSNAWLSFVPFANIYAFGRIAEKYIKLDGRPSAKFSKILLALYIIMCVLAVVLIIFILVFIIIESIADPTIDAFLSSDAVSASVGVTFILPLILLMLGILGVCTAYVVIYYIALWRIFAIYDGDNATLYLVLSIFFSFLAPIFLFVLRNRQPNIMGWQQSENVT